MITPEVVRRIRANPLPAQRSLALDRDRAKRLVALIGGYRSGKTVAAAMKMIALGIENAPCMGLMVAPTYTMARDVLFRTTAAYLDAIGLPYVWRKHESTFTVAPGYPQQFDVLLRSGDRPDRLVGLTVGWAIIDEPGLQKAEVAEQVWNRVSDPRAKVPQMVLTGTPEGMSNWLYEWLVTKPMPGTRVIRARTTDNTHLSAGYVPSLLARYSPEQVEQYINGEFVLLEGGAYDEFKRSKHHAKAERPFRGEVCVGADFNWGRYLWPIVSVNGEQGHVFGEALKENANTWDAADLLIDRLQALHVQHEGQPASIESLVRMTTIYADASGEQRKSSASKSDLAILRSKGFRVVAPASNPRIKDRMTTLNARFRLDRMRVDCEAAPEMARALEQQKRGPDGLPLKDGILDAATDALGYLCWMRPGWRTTALHGNADKHIHHFH